MTLHVCVCVVPGNMTKRSQTVGTSIYFFKVASYICIYSPKSEPWGVDAALTV